MALCGNCQTRDARAGDYLCTKCRLAIGETDARPALARIVDLAIQMNNHPVRVLVSENDHWLLIDLVREEQTQFPWMTTVRYLRSFVVWKNTAKVFRHTRGQPIEDDDEIPDDEVPFELQYPEEDDVLL